jgi:tripeptide aminopeptidase
MKHLVEQIDSTLKWDWLPARTQQVIEDAITIQQIPAPTFHEQERSRYIAQQFAVLGLKQIETDDFYNVYGLLPGKGRPGVMISAHTDTVFEENTNLEIRRESDLIFGPGLGDNSMGVAGLLGLARSLMHLAVTPERDVWFVANTREEALGDLGGMKAAFARLKPQICQVINLEGMAFGHVYHAGTAVRRLHITATTAGGHSWLNYGRASAIHGIVELGARITALHPPQSPRTTFNIGMIDGGQTINSIATKASLWLDMRSEDSATLAAFEQQVRAQVEAVTKPDLPFIIEVVGDRPAGFIAPEHPLVQEALAALALVGVRGTLENGSTDANVPLAYGTPAVTVGITRGGNAHRLDEYVELPPIADGLRQLIVLTLAAAQQNP